MIFASEFALCNSELGNPQVIIDDALLFVTEAPWR